MSIVRDALRPLPLVPPPLRGEALSSWLGRVAAEYWVSVGTLLTHIGLPTPPGRWLCLPALSDAELKIMSARLRTSLTVLRQMNAQTCSLAAQAPLGFCPHCLKTDVVLSRPLHWRRDWLDAFSVCCQVHDVALAPVGAATLGRGGNWQHAAMHPRDLLDLQAAELDPALAEQYASARALQDTLSFNPRSARRMADYGVWHADQLRSIAMDLLNLLLGRFGAKRGQLEPSLLMRIALLRNEPLPLDELIVYPVWARERLVTRVRSMRGRYYALSVANALLMHSVRVAHGRAEPRLNSDSALRTTWLWTLMSETAHKFFVARSRAWPQAYVQRCWPELVDQPDGNYLPRRALLGRRVPLMTHRDGSTFEPATIRTDPLPSQASCASAAINDGLHSARVNVVGSGPRQSGILA